VDPSGAETAKYFADTTAMAVWLHHLASGRRLREIGEQEESCRILAGTTEGKSALERPRCSWMDDVKIDLGEIGWGGVDWFDVAQGRDRMKGCFEHGNDFSGL
jgi:hypothetical protein